MSLPEAPSPGGRSPAALSPGALTDVAGLQVGHATRPERPTGCTVVLCPQGLVCGVAVRGGAPGTRETDLLRPENTVDRVHAVLLTGGSAFGLDAAGGVMRWLEERGHGWPVGTVARVPIVPAAVIFDLWLGDARIRPDAGTGYAACEAAAAAAPGDTAVTQGRVGAGAGATVGKLGGITQASRGGLGTASLREGGFTVAALVVVNAIGDVFDGQGRVLAGRRGAADAGGADGAGRPGPAADQLAGSATTIGVVATDATLTKAQCTQLAGLAHHGLARTVHPVTAHDGDSFFALATGAMPAASADMLLLGRLASEAVTLAVRNAVIAAR